MALPRHPLAPRPYNPNSGSPGRPSKDGISVGKAMLPTAQTAYSIEQYVDVFSKALSLPPSVMSFARMSSMPDQYASGVIQWPGIAPASMGKVARENLAPQLIIGLRTADVERYADYSTHLWKPGWRIELRSDSKHPNKADLQDIQEARDFLYNCNIETINARRRDESGYLNFRNFLSALTRDSLTYDGMAIWTDIDSRGQVKSFKPLSSANIRLVGKEGYQEGMEKFDLTTEEAARVFSVLVDEAGNVIDAFNRDQLCWFVRNPRLDPVANGYGYSEIEIGVRLIQAFQNALDMNADAFCYAEDTEVLTQSGWKFFDQVDISVDKFATINPDTRELQYQSATHHIWQEYSGEMYALKSRSIDMIVTPNHRVVYEYRPGVKVTGKHKIQICEARKLYNKFQTLGESSRKNYAIPTTSVWRGREIKEKAFVFGMDVIGGTKLYEKTKKRGGSRRLRTISGDDYCAFMGAYLSEGHLNRTRKRDASIRIAQMPYSKGFAPFKELLMRIFPRKVQYNTGASSFILGWAALSEHLRQFGTHSYNKIIPDDILNATPRQQKIFWEYLVLGDGSTSTQRGGSQSTHVATTSKIMADQLQELCQKMGYSATICTVTDPIKYKPKINGRFIKSCRTRYDVYIRTSPMRSMDMHKVDYVGKIGCVTVPNGTLYVRRKGKAIWSGNSSNSIPNGILMLKGMGWNQKQLDVLARIWTNMKSGVTKQWALPAVAVPKDGEMEILDLSRMKGLEAYYQDFMNMVAGAFCAVYKFPVQRLGYRISGARDPTRMPQESQGLVDETDPGLPVLLGQLETPINEYLLWSRWPHLKFGFTGKNPKEDAREYEERSLARTVKERRASADLPSLASEAPKEFKDVAELMDLCPTDPALAGVYQALVAAKLAAKAGADKGPEAVMSRKVDAARSEEHGATSGVRRDSAKESKDD